MESYLASLFPVWSAGMALEKFDILEKTTDEASTSSD